MIRTIIVDDELLAGAGLQSLIDGVEDISVAKVFTVAGEAVEYLRENMIDIVITDIEMADMSGLDLIQTVRSEGLADGVIIVSCHNDFSYAQEAISKGTDSYLLKYDISGEKLVREIHKVYEKTHQEARRVPNSKQFAEQAEKKTDLDYILCIPAFFSKENPGRPADVDTTMLAHLLDGILERYKMGTLFTPYDRRMFIVFELERTLSEDECRKLMYSDYETIARNLEQYVSCRPVLALSSRFHDTKKMRDQYTEAEEALNLRFYEPKSDVFFYRKPESTASDLPEIRFYRLFQDDFKEEILERKLNEIVTAAHIRKIPEEKLKGKLVERIVDGQYRLQWDYPLSPEIREKWGAFSPAVLAVRNSIDSRELVQNLLEAILELRADVLGNLRQDEIGEILNYIEQNLDEKITLPALAERAHMSVPSFGRKFKERTDMTLVQYLNTRRIEAAKKLLLNRNLTLDQISEKTGFSSTNYMVRVFKKITGQTISDFRM